MLSPLNLSKGDTELADAFVRAVDKFRARLSLIKKECDEFEDAISSKEGEVLFLKNSEKKFFKFFDVCFDQLWLLMENLEPDERLKYQSHLIKELDPFLRENLEVVTYIRARPLGYAGDYVTMNYIYDYNNSWHLGESLYEKLLNHYTCSIKVSCSNIARKNHIKKRILESLDREKATKILSVGSGPARELIELLKENKITSPVRFNCLDFEKEAISYVKDQLQRIRYDSDLIKIKFFQKNLLEFVKNKNLAESFHETHLVYVSGVFDYLTGRICGRVLKNLFQLLSRGGVLIVFNMSLEDAQHRAYYETFAKWEMRHRTKEEMLSWVKDEIKGCKFSIDDIDDCPSYHILNIIRE